MDPKRAQVYIYNNIFFSFAVDSRDQYEVLLCRFASSSLILKSTLIKTELWR